MNTPKLLGILLTLACSLLVIAVASSISFSLSVSRELGMQGAQVTQALAGVQALRAGDGIVMAESTREALEAMRRQLDSFDARLRAIEQWRAETNRRDSNAKGRPLAPKGG